MRSITLTLSFLVTAFAGLITAAAAEKPAPNILYIFTDDQSYRTVSCYPRAYNFANTPNIDRLAQRGVRFDQAYIGAKCVPSRATALTGRLQFAVESNYDGTDIEGNTYWFPTIRDKGYYTGMIGKWHYGKGAEVHQHGTSWDWSVVWDHGSYDAAGGYYYDQFVMINGAPQVPLGGYSTDRYTDYTEEFIRERAKQPDKPWFYWLCYGAVHGPYTPAERHQGMLEDKPETEIPADVWGPRAGKPAHFQDSRWQKGEDGKPYRGGKSLDFWVKQQTEAVAAIDEGVGRIVKTLEETGQLDNTIIVFTADQGYVWGHHGLKGKIDPYETAIRSPLIVSCPKRFPVGKVCKAPINGPDVIRTFHAWAEAEPRLFMPGRDITPLVMNPDSEPVLEQWSKVPTMMTYVHNRYEPMEMARRLKNKEWKACMYSKDAPWYFMILVENYKYTRYAHPARIEELYDLDKDPEELDNLAVKEEFKDKLLAMRAACIQSIKDNGGSVFANYLPPPNTGDAPAVDEPTVEKPSGDTIVYFSGHGKRVHVEGCKRLTGDLDNMTRMTLAEAEAKGLPLCSKCPGSTTTGHGDRQLPENVPGDTTVYHTEGKNRVHRVGCRRLSTDPKVLATMTKMTLAEAKAKGLSLCSRCPGSTTPR